MGPKATLTNGSSIDLLFPGSGSKDGFEHSIYTNKKKKARV